jgi:hypothetical protein
MLFGPREVRMRVFALALALGPLGGCYIADEDPPPQVVHVVHHESSIPWPTATATAPGRIPILQAHHMDRPTEVIAILDVHSAMGQENQALEELRARAQACGADAVVGAEFHHGEGAGEPTHLSGVAVRFISLDDL